jgi:hypothetical protein
MPGSLWMALKRFFSLRQKNWPSLHSRSSDLPAPLFLGWNQIVSMEAFQESRYRALRERGGVELRVINYYVEWLILNLFATLEREGGAAAALVAIRKTKSQ